MYYELKKEYYWLNMLENIKCVLKSCEECSIMNRKKKGGFDFVATSRKFEKFAIDIMYLEETNRFVLLCIDYFSRFVSFAFLERKTSSCIIMELDKIFKKLRDPEMLVCDAAAEFSSKEFNVWIKKRNITLHRTAIESHRSNGRIERVIRTIREQLLKMKGESYESFNNVIDKYNQTYHAGIKCSPVEALNDVSGQARMENNIQGNYIKKFTKRYRESFNIGQKVRVAKNDNLKKNVKGKKGRFLDLGVIIEKCIGDSYLIKKNDGKIVKKRHYDLKGICLNGETPSRERDVIYNYN